MRGTVAKKLRRQARKVATSSERKVRWAERLTGKTDSEGKPHKHYSGTLFWTGFRRIYKDMKKQYKESRAI